MSSVASENDEMIDLDSFDSESIQNEEVKTKRRKRSNVWAFFEMVPDSENNDGKPRAKCKMCGVIYMAASKYGTDNMRRHIETCPRRSSRDIGQMMLSQNSENISVSAHKFDTEQYREILVSAIVKHELPFRFVEYSGRHSEGEDDYMKRMCCKMLAKFEKYWSEFNVLLAIAVILDPRYKLHFVDFSYTKLYGECSIEYMNVRSKMSSLFMEYGSSSAPTTTCSTTTSDSTEFDTFRPDELSGYMKKSQLDLYLDEPRAERNAKIDILSFWKGNEFRYPDLARMARDILSVPVSTVASESTFSVGRRIIDQFRSALKADIVEALVCTRDWLYEIQEEVKLDELTEDVMELENNKGKGLEDAPPHSSSSRFV
ncbi:zinc finger BED domain-containing protein DAYSLEEPER-like [Juglans regia]|uniref:Zinc finger BED domain-containing protein DAYSLEEPER-like n=1 Tax=Juglans regia TaxID=51240 RepID=A0A6P9EJA5_JUGRE|nr:zinc finger BED domain-containing protein DAYSLEEPER-like [Juglans regia]